MSPWNSQQQIASQTDDGDISSSSNAPACVTYARSKSLGDFRTDISLGCGKTAGTILALISTTAGGGKESKPTSTAGSTTNSTPKAGVTQSADGPASSNASTGSTTTGSSNGSSNKMLSTGEIAAIVIPIVAIIAAFIVGWWKRHQVTWLLTCGAFGYRHSNKPAREEGPRPYAAPLAPMPAHANYGPIKVQSDTPPIYTPQRPFLYQNQPQHAALPPRNTTSTYQNSQASQPFLPGQPQNQLRPTPQGWIAYDGVRWLWLEFHRIYNFCNVITASFFHIYDVTYNGWPSWELKKTLIAFTAPRCMHLPLHRSTFHMRPFSFHFSTFHSVHLLAY